jgi:hypothetical protein
MMPTDKPIASYKRDIIKMYGLLDKLPHTNETTCLGNLLTQTKIELDRYIQSRTKSIYTLAAVGRNVFELCLIVEYVLFSAARMNEWMGQRISDEVQLLESMRLMSPTGADLSWIDGRISDIRSIGEREGITEAKYKLPREYADSLGRTDEYSKYYRIFSKFTHPSSWVINENKEKLESHEAFNWFFMKKTETYTVEILARVATYIDSRIPKKQSKEVAQNPEAAI